ncbi:solute carrier family 35 member E3-like [Pollicipes pollicipes]|uniref:solute carrier family 35 member E3-like n=1 Tax=Pollicipes pollicipes TaxID=41117 RepID=UPI001884BFB1|nr:solute carrier family 35 member E3-like [Pollicipes pollicipes]XP_037093286.1 solute carrier family 35 member E3-like [Pollicipes pollicipes]
MSAAAAPAAPPSRTLVAAHCCANVALSITLVLLNKWVYTHVGFPNMTLTLLHFVTSFALCALSLRAGLFAAKRVPLLDMLPLAAAFCGFVVLTNLSLQYNTVGTYQVAKVMTTPGVIAIGACLYGRSFTFGVKLCTIPITVGVILNFCFDLKFNVIGFFMACAGVVVTSFYQVWVGRVQTEHRLNGLQLLLYQAPLSAGLLLCVAPLFESVSETLSRPLTPQQTALVVCSCVMAFVINLSIYWLIGNTSPLTYNMIGHSKFCLTVAAGFIVFHDPLQLNQIMGISLTMLGIIVYSHLKMKQSASVRLPTVNGALKRSLM